MKTNQFWIEIVALGTAIAFALALLIATLGAAAVAVAEHSKSARVEWGPNESGQAAESASVQQQTREGMVTCSRCGAKHSADFGKTAGDCARQCVRGGARFALVDGDKTYVLDGNPELLKKVAGQRARIVGTVRGNTITVSTAGAGS
jgi:uncharacterized low-complexity protein